MKKYHEVEQFILKSDKLNSRKQLHQFLRSRGFTSIDDFYVLDRKNQYPAWQSEEVISLAIRRDGTEVYETAEDMEEYGATDWTDIQCEYLLATLPRECIALALDEVGCLCKEFDLKVYWNGRVLGVPELSDELHSIADQLSQEFGEPGSEALDLIIEEEFDRDSR
jgi:hypothetical protein